MATDKTAWVGFHFFYHADPRILLRHYAGKLLQNLLDRNYIDRFFFIVYNLGGPHVRLRFRLSEGSAAEVGTRAAELANTFLVGHASTAKLNAEDIRRQSLAILEAAPEDSELVYPNNSLFPFPFRPEWERYGGATLMDPSLDFFAISSLRCLDLLSTDEDDSAGHRFTVAARTLAQQALGFAASEKELWDLLSYRLPIGEERVDAVLARADQVYAKNTIPYQKLLASELARVSGNRQNTPQDRAAGWLNEGAARLSTAIQEADDAARWQIATSQMHMTANRLGHHPAEELYLLRLLWRAAKDLSLSEPATWQQALDRQTDRLALLASQVGKTSQEAQAGGLLPDLLAEILVQFQNKTPTSASAPRN